ncbi:MAG: hypothetical protein PHG06_21570 [Parabacteroides sp.]|nr:hypothetical protein [Parabacteroides sp.]
METLYLGIDVGSVSTDFVVMNEDLKIIDQYCPDNQIAELTGITPAM